MTCKIRLNNFKVSTSSQELLSGIYNYSTNQQNQQASTQIILRSKLGHVNGIVNVYISQGGHFCLLIGPKNIKTLRSCFLSSFVEFCSTVSEEKSKMSQQSEASTAILFFFFPIGQKNTNLVEDIAILLPVNFCWILFSGFSGEVENVSANRRPGRPSCFSDPPEKHKTGRGHWDLASCQVFWNSVQRFQRRSRKCLSQSKARAAIFFVFPISPKNTNFVEDVEILLPVKFHCRNSVQRFQRRSRKCLSNQRPGRPSCFSDRPEKHKLGKGRWDVASCQVSLHSVQWFQKRSRKCEKLTSTDDGRRTTRDHNIALEPSLRLRCTKKILLLKCIHHFKTDLINNIGHMLI